MIDKITYKLQGNGDDSWVIDYSDGTKGIVSLLTVDNWKLKAILKEDGLLLQVETALKNLPEPAKSNAGFAWEYSPVINSNSNATNLIRSVLQLSKDEMMNVFVRAINLEI